MRRASLPHRLFGDERAFDAFPRRAERGDSRGEIAACHTRVVEQALELSSGFFSRAARVDELAVQAVEVVEARFQRIAQLVALRRHLARVGKRLSEA